MCYSYAVDVTLVLYISAMCSTLQVDDLRKENQHLKRTTSKVNNLSVTAEVTGDKFDEQTFEAHDQYPENPTVDPPFIHNTSKLHSPPPPEIPQPESVEVPTESVEIQEDVTIDVRPVHTCHDIPEHILPIIESKESETHDFDVLDLRKLENTTDSVVVQPPSILNTCIVEESYSPVHELQGTEESDITKPFKKSLFFENVTVTNMV